MFCDNCRKENVAWTTRTSCIDFCRISAIWWIGSTIWKPSSLLMNWPKMLLELKLFSNVTRNTEYGSFAIFNFAISWTFESECNNSISWTDVGWDRCARGQFPRHNRCRTTARWERALGRARSQREAHHALGGEAELADSMGGAPHSLRTMHGPATLLQVPYQFVHIIPFSQLSSLEPTIYNQYNLNIDIHLIHRPHPWGG